MSTPKITFPKKPNVLSTPNEALNDLLGGNITNQNDITEIAIDKLIPYRSEDGKPQPFDIYPTEKLAGLAERIALMGVLSPIIVRPHNTEKGSYEIIAGHNRTKASQMAGKSTVPSIVMDLDDDAARLIMIETNLDQREKLTIKEKALAFKEKLELENRQGQRTDLTSRQFVAKFTQAERRKAQRYAKLLDLTQELFNLICDKTIPVEAGYHLAFLSAQSQELLLAFVSNKKLKTISIDQASDIRAAGNDNELTEDDLNDIFFPVKEEKSNKPKPIKIKPASIQEYIPKNIEDAEDFIIHALAYYKENHNDEYK